MTEEVQCVRDTFDDHANARLRVLEQVFRGELQLQLAGHGKLVGQLFDEGCKRLQASLLEELTSQLASVRISRDPHVSNGCQGKLKEPPQVPRALRAVELNPSPVDVLPAGDCAIPNNAMYGSSRGITLDQEESLSEQIHDVMTPRHRTDTNSSLVNASVLQLPFIANRIRSADKECNENGNARPRSSRALQKGSRDCGAVSSEGLQWLEKSHAESSYKARDTEWQNTVRKSVVPRFGPKISERPVWVTAMLSVLDALPKFPPSQRMVRLVRGRAFNLMMSAMLLINAAFLGYEADQMASHALKMPPTEVPAHLKIINAWLSAVFLVELLVRAAAYRGMFFYEQDWKWNAFDTLMVILSIPEQAGLHMMAHGRVARLFRMYRIARILRFARTVRTVGALRGMIWSIYNAFDTLFWAICIIAVTIFVFAVFFLQVIAWEIEEHGDEHLKVLLRRRYGGLDAAMWSLFYVSSGGMDWHDVMSPLEQLYPPLKALFGFYVVLMWLGMVNILAGIFCEKAMEGYVRDKDLLIWKEQGEISALVEQMTKIFYDMDSEKTGEVTWEQFREYIQQDDAMAYFHAKGLNTLDAFQLFRLFDEIDGNPSDTMDLDSFILGVLRIAGPARSTDLQMLLHESRRNAQLVQDFFVTIIQRLRRLEKALDDDALEKVQRSDCATCQSSSASIAATGDCEVKEESTVPEGNYVSDSHQPHPVNWSL